MLLFDGGWGMSVLLVVLPLVLLAVTLMLFRTFAGDGNFWHPPAPEPGEEATPAPPRPWWGSPGLWIGVSIVSLVVGVLVLPKMFGVLFLFLPFVWVGGTRRSRRRG